MFVFDTLNCSDTVICNVLNQFNNFLTVEGHLPLFRVSFFNRIPVLQDLMHLKTINSFRFYTSNHHYYIFYMIGCEIRAIVKMPSYFNDVEAYYNLDYANADYSFGRSDIADLLYHAYKYRAVSCRDMMIHAAAIVYNNEGILFCGGHTAGKSTQANLWKKYMGAWILNYDSPCIIVEDKQIDVSGSPWSGKEQLYINDSVPLRAIVFVQKADYNSVVALTRAEAFSLLYLNNYLFPFNPDIENRYITIVQEIAARIPVFKLNCTISEEAVSVLYDIIYDRRYLGW